MLQQDPSTWCTTIKGCTTVDSLKNDFIVSKLQEGSLIGTDRAEENNSTAESKFKHDESITLKFKMDRTSFKRVTF